MCTRSETVGKVDAVKVVSRAIIQDGSVGFPPDLQPGNLVVAEQLQARTGLHAILDIDCFYDQRERFDFQRIQEHLIGIHDQITKSFETSVTSHAFEVWS